MVINTIARNTFREHIRNRVLYVIGAIAILLIGFAHVLGDWAVFNRVYVVTSFTLSVMSLSGLLISIFVGVGLVHTEIEKHTLYTIVTKPVSRTQFLLGKYIGLLYIIGCHLTLLSVAFVIAVLLSGGSVTFEHLLVIILKGAEMSLIIAIALFFSTFSSTALSAFFTFGIYIAGQTLPSVLDQIAFTKKIGSANYSEIQESIAQILHTIIPDFTLFNRSHELIHSIPLTIGDVSLTLCYGLLYSVLLLTGASLWFHRKEFT
ncbi:MAG: ABC transporter permease subunit [Fibrobacterales bacterium]